MLWLSQVFENINIADVLEISKLLEHDKSLWFPLNISG